jgi:glutathione peroxidase
MSLFDYALPGLQGGTVRFDTDQPKAVLLVNVASRCGLTPQYKQLEALWRGNQARGLRVVGLPCNQFAAQEAGSAEQIAQFCALEYGVSFPLTGKIAVNGPERHPLYAFLAGADATFPGDIQWNFEKFLCDGSGSVVARFAPTVRPDDPQVLSALGALLA